MQIVIDIDEETLQDLYDSRYVSPHIKDVFRSATPLPKGHGDLIDRSKLEYLKAIHDEKYGLVSWSEAIKRIKYSAPTIIEADKADSEG